MKIKNIYLFSVLLLAFSITFSGCEESDDYDYNAIEPIVQGVAGPNEVRGGTTISYRAIGRGGSTYAFSYEGAIESLTPVEGEVFGVVVEYTESVDTTTAVLSVVETTLGGKQSPAYNLSVTVTPLNVNITGNDDLAVIEDTPIERSYSVDFLYPSASYAWSVAGDDVEIIGDANGSSVVLKYDYPTEPIQDVVLSVQVTTRKGNVITDEMDIIVKQFCPLVIEELLGEMVGSVALGEGACPQTAEITEVDEETNTIHMTGFADFLVGCLWGENWVEGDGTVKVMLHEPEGLVTIPLQWIGQSDFPDNYWVRGEVIEEDAEHHGVYDFCGPVITVSFNIAYGGEVDEDGLPVDEDDLTWVFNPEAPPVSTFTFASDDKGNSFLQLINVAKK